MKTFLGLTLPSVLLSTAVVALASDSPCLNILSPRDAAVVLESEIAGGVGVLIPDPLLPVVLGPHRVAFDVPGADWPDAFVEAVCALPFDADVGGWRISATVNSTSGATVFSDETGTAVWVENPPNPVPFNWVAPFRRLSSEPSDSDVLFEPSRVRMEFVFGFADDFDAFDQLSATAAVPIMPRLLSPRNDVAPLDTESGLENSSDGNCFFRWTAFRPASNEYSVAVAWPATNFADFAAIDVLFKNRLEDRGWRWIYRHEVPDASTLSNSFAIPASAIPVIVSPDSSPPLQTNVVFSPFGIWYTNVLSTLPGQLRQNSGFFLAANIRDTDADGLTDAMESLCFGTDPDCSDTDSDTIPDNWEVLFGMDPTNPEDAILDMDSDGLPNVYEYHNGCDPRIPDFENASRIIAGDTGTTNSAPTLASALALSYPYGVVEIASGLHSGNGWEGLWMPNYPVLVTTGNGGRSRNSRLRLTGDGLAAFYLDEEQPPHTVFQGISVELAGSSAFQAAFWLGDGNPWSGPGASAFFKNVHVILGCSQSQRVGWYCRHSTDNSTYFSGCSVDATGCDDAIGVDAIDSSSLVLEHCSFFGFPSAADGRAYAVLTQSTPQATGGAADPISVILRNCLFDESFTNALVIAPLTNGVAYRTRMESCLVPNWPEYPPTVESGTVVATVGLVSGGHLSLGCPAIDAGRPAILSSVDFDGENRDSAPDIGADEWTNGLDTDSDSDGLSNAAETELGTEPFLADTDGDGISDFVEISEDTDPLDSGSFCFELAGTAWFANEVPTNTLLGVVSASPARTAFVSTPVSGTNAVFHFPHVVVTNAPKARLALFADIDGDGKPGESESAAFFALTPTGHLCSVDAHFSAITDDVDGDGILDAWEFAHGLSTTNSLDAWEDPDGDGLVNLHEYWHDYDPLVADGSNTVLSVIARSVDSRLAGKNPATAMPVYENYLANAATNVFIRNTNCWTHGIDFSCASPWNGGDYGHWRAGTLISPRHIVFAAHFPINGNPMVYFHSPSGSVYGSRLIAKQQVGDTDIEIGLLDEEIPSAVKPAKILPQNFQSYIRTGEGLPVLCLDQEEKAIVCEMSSFFTNSTMLNCRIPRTNTRNAFHETVVLHDSGNPRFLTIGNEVILLNCMLGPMSGPSLSHYRDVVNETMNALYPGYQLQEADFSGYPILPAGGVE